jgi:signal recognition particle GTPase
LFYLWKLFERSPPTWATRNLSDSQGVDEGLNASKERTKPEKNNNKRVFAPSAEEIRQLLETQSKLRKEEKLLQVPLHVEEIGQLASSKIRDESMTEFFRDLNSRQDFNHRSRVLRDLMEDLEEDLKKEDISTKEKEEIREYLKNCRSSMREIFEGELYKYNTY